MIDAVFRALEADPPARAASEALARAGASVYAVGGTVRDALLGATPHDVDLLAVGLPREDVERTLAALPGRVDYTGASFGVFRYRHRRREVEVALPRTERSSGPGHRDFAVVADHRLAVEDDLARRDFTANALAVELASGRLVDPFGGRADIEARVLRTVSPQSFREDPLRIVRALVARARHGLAPDAETRRQMAAQADALVHLPQERIRLELEKLLAGAEPAAALELAQETGVLARVLPELAASLAAGRAGPALAALAALPPDPGLRLAALLHPVGARAAAAALRRLRFPVETIERVARLVRLDGFAAFDTPAGARRFLRRAGEAERGRELLALRAALEPGAANERMRGLVDAELAAVAPYALAHLAVGGADLLAAGVPQGPEVGRLLQALLDRVVDDPSLNDRERLLALLPELRA